LGAFADSTQISEGWYVLGSSKMLRRGPVTIQVGAREVVAYRDAQGNPRVVDPQCSHLGGHLGLGRVEAGGLTCALHAWCWAADGTCPRPEAQGRQLGIYRAQESWGLVWAWLGDDTPLPFPVPPGPAGSRAIRLPRQTVRAHPHLVLGNGFDPGHFGPLHGLRLLATEVRDESPHRLEHHVQATLPKGGRWAVIGVGGKEIKMTFATHGAAAGMVEVEKPWRFGVLFTCMPTADGGTYTQTILFVPRLRLLPRALALVWSTTLEDIAQMEAQEFRPGFVAGDATLEAYVRRTGAVPAWTGGGKARKDPP
jgi:phenylpropionate dioxygenase-like ring-hydroxylating dioxygenase large terminal subunit